MANQRFEAKSVSVTLNPKGQNVAIIHQVVAGILNHCGCPECGLMGVLTVKLVSDPPPDLAKANATSFETQGF